MANPKATDTAHYRVKIAGLAYRKPGTEGIGTIVALKGEVIELDADEALRLSERDAIEETDQDPTPTPSPVENAPERAQARESPEENAAKQQAAQVAPAE